ncbi:UbiA prenyltransferase family protein [Streptomyces sp. NPDC048737]|uniref:UbiA prenyltransferase family protein n=1 Tax=unclassified Streptomyces TaxID=2593676 RepID=UPI003418E33C
MPGVNSTVSPLPSTPAPASSAPTAPGAPTPTVPGAPAATAPTPTVVLPAPAAHSAPPVALPPAGPLHRVLRVPRALLRLSRPYQWAKNPVVIALPAVLLHRGTAQAALAVLAATALFTLASIAVYVLNDILDRERDRLNPAKSHRPLASGELSPGAAWTYLAVVCAALAAGVALASVERAWPVLVYLALNLAYSYRLKHVSLVDAFVVAVGFVLRAVQGYLALGARPSSWLLLTVLTGCLLLALGKRRRELLDVGGEHRPALAGYSVQFIDYLTLVSATLSAVALGIYLTAAPDESPEATALVFLTLGTSVFAVCRYLQLLLVGGGGADPVRTLFRDRLMVGCGLVWAGAFMLLS